MAVKASILISSYNRINLWKRTLWGIATRPPSCSFEVIVVDDGSDEDTLGELKKYSARFPWKFIRFDAEEFTKKTGIAKFWNNSSPTQNIAFKHSQGELIFQQGNEIIPWGKVYDQMIADIPATECYIIFSTTYDIPQQYLCILDSHGQSLRQPIVDACQRWVLQSSSYRSDVTNYISMVPRFAFQQIGGFDERYFGGISSEDSDFVRRLRALPGFHTVISEGVSLHQYHQGKTTYYDPPVSVISKERFKEGCDINHKIYEQWDGSSANSQPWEWGTYGVKEVISNA